MQRDFKTGMALGLVLVVIVAVLLSTRPNLSIKARMQSPQSAVHRKIGRPAFSPSVEHQKETAINEQLKEIKADSPQGEVLLKADKFHVVRAGETLTDISLKYYGSADKWRRILEANRSRLKDANTLRPGMKLTIPQ